MNWKLLITFTAGLCAGGGAVHCLDHARPPAVIAPAPGAQGLALHFVPAVRDGDGAQTFAGDDLRLTLEKLAKAAGVEIVISPRVKGTITAALENASPREAIDVIAMAKDLRIEQTESTLYVKTPAEMNQIPLRLASYTFKNARAEEVKEIVKAHLGSGLDVQADARTNTIFFVEDQRCMDQTQVLLERLDQPVKSEPGRTGAAGKNVGRAGGRLAKSR